MLTPQLVRSRKQGKELKLRGFSKKDRPRAELLAGELLNLARASVGESRRQLEARLNEVPFSPRERKLKLGLIRLIDQACEFQAGVELDVVELRREVFEEAALARKGDHFDRTAVLKKVAGGHGLDADAVEAALYADLRGEHKLQAAPDWSASALLGHYELSERQAVLLRAVEVNVCFESFDTTALRQLFSKLKFRQLLFELDRGDDERIHLKITGPFNVFEQVTKYGMALAQLQPVLESCGPFELVARLSWGKKRDPLTYHYTHRDAATSDVEVSPLTEAARGVLEAFQRRDSPWTVAPAKEIISLPGVGLCVPDLAFQHRHGGPMILFEVLGYWSRAAVWRRVELVETGRCPPMVFAVSRRLRVSEEVLDGDDRAMLYVFKGTPSARAIERKLDELLQQLTKA